MTLWTLRLSTLVRRKGAIMRRLRLSEAACIVFVVCVASMASAQTFTTLANFDGSNGAYPSAALIQATDGNLYGTTFDGGAYGAGTVFTANSAGTVTTFYSFGLTSSRGPLAPVVQATDGNFYGTAGGGPNGWGTVFKITPDGTLGTVLYEFCSQGGCSDGSAPKGLIRATDGNFYGTTGGGAGTVFKITPAGTLTTLHYFCSKLILKYGRYVCADGKQPHATLVQGTNGSFYGTTINGGSYDQGVVFQIAPAGKLAIPYRFCSDESCPDGWDPEAELIQATNGSFYGTASEGGANGWGTIFKIAGSKMTRLYSFCSQTNCVDGGGPLAALVQATDGNFYGTAAVGGANDWGTIFKITREGVLTTLHSFCAQPDCADGAYPTAGLVQATDGSFYGTTWQGGTGGSGTVFRLSVGLGPFVKTQPASGEVGAPVVILGTNLTGATGVSFSGTAATFTVVSSSEITTAVPVGAKSGTVTVKTPAGALKSNVRFRVTP